MLSYTLISELLTFLNIGLKNYLILKMHYDDGKGIAIAHKGIGVNKTKADSKYLYKVSFLKVVKHNRTEIITQSTTII